MDSGFFVLGRMRTGEVSLSCLPSENGNQAVGKTEAVPGKSKWRQPGGHGLWKTDQNHNIRHHCRVEDILTQTSVQVFGKTNGE